MGADGKIDVHLDIPTAATQAGSRFWKEEGPSGRRVHSEADRGGGLLQSFFCVMKVGRDCRCYAASMANCSAREGFGLNAYLACRLRIM